MSKSVSWPSPLREVPKIVEGPTGGKASTLILQYSRQNRRPRIFLICRVAFFLVVFAPISPWVNVAKMGQSRQLKSPQRSMFRPHFIDACQPNIPFDADHCGPVESPVFVVNYTCLGLDSIEEAERQDRVKVGILSTSLILISDTQLLSLIFGLEIANIVRRN